LVARCSRGRRGDRRVEVVEVVVEGECGEWRMPAAAAAAASA